MSEPIFLPDLAGLSEPERQFVLDARDGRACDLNGQTIGAKVVSDLIREARTGWTVGARQLRLHNASIFGTVSLGGTQFDAQLSFDAVTFRPQADAPALDLTDAQCDGLTLRRCRLLGPVHADGVVIAQDVILKETEITEGVSIDAARIGGGFCLTRCNLKSPDVAPAAVSTSPVAFSGRAMQVRSGVLLDDTEADGVISLREARVLSGLSAARLKIRASGRALDLRSVRVGDGVDISGGHFQGALSAVDADVGGDWHSDGVVTSGEDGRFEFSGLRVAGPLTMVDAQCSQLLDLSGADIGRDVHIKRSVVGGGSQSINLTGGRFLGHVTISRVKCAGEIRLNDGLFERSLRIVATRIYGGRNAVLCSGLTVAQDFDLSQSYVFGALRLGDCRVGRNLVLSGAALKVDEDEAFEAAHAEIARDARFDAGFQSSGGLVLDRARIAGRLTFQTSRIVSAALARGGRPSRASLNAVIGPEAEDAAGPTGAVRDDADLIAVSLKETRTGSLLFPNAESDRPKGIVDLSGAITDLFVDDESVWPPARAKRGLSADGRDIDHWRLNGFAYGALSHLDGVQPGAAARGGRTGRVSPAEQRLKWLDGQHEDDLGRDFKAQPWRHLEQTFVEAGLSWDAEEVALGREALRAVSPREPIGSRIAGSLLGVLTGHGYRPWRSVWVFLAGCTLMVLISVLAAGQCRLSGCQDQTVFVKSRLDGYDAKLVDAVYPGFDPIVYGLDTVVPFVSLGQADHWTANPNWWPLWRVSIGAQPQANGQISNPVADRASEAASGQGRGYLFAITGGRLLAVLAGVMQLFGLLSFVLMVLAFGGWWRRA